jgi:Protein of unknown function (DUF4238)
VPRDHIVPRFLLARWADPETGKIVVWDRRSGRASSEVDPADHSTVEDFNVDRRADGTVDSWLESELFAGLENRAAGSLNQLEQVQPTMKHIKRLARGGLEAFHLLPRRRTMGLAMFIGAQMVRSPHWRGSIERATCLDMEADMKAGVREELDDATDPTEIARLEELLGVRYVAVTTDKATQIQLSGHLAYKIGTILYRSFFWSMHRFAEPSLVLGDEPVILALDSAPSGFGSLADIAFEREVLSLQRGLEQIVKGVVEIVSSAKAILLPFGPRHALVLNPIESLCLPGRYDRSEEDAKLFNTWTRASSREWAVWQPGMEPEALDGRELAALVVDAIRADRFLPPVAR